MPEVVDLSFFLLVSFVPLGFNLKINPHCLVCIFPVTRS